MFLHESTVYGPLKSRRLGSSLGINLLPNKRKVCNFECIYCECGWTNVSVKDSLPSLAEFARQLENKLKELNDQEVSLNYITFAGNGEPTLHPEFSAIVDKTIELRDRHAPDTRIAVLSNATTLQKTSVLRALKKVDDPVMKMDAGSEELFQAIDLPDPGLTLDRLTSDLMQFDGNLTIQTMFLRGTYEGRSVDNTTDSEIAEWQSRLLRIRPRKVMMYTIDRQTPADGLQKINKSELETIARRVRASGLIAETFD